MRALPLRPLISVVTGTVMAIVALTGPSTVAEGKDAASQGAERSDAVTGFIDALRLLTLVAKEGARAPAELTVRAVVEKGTWKIVYHGDETIAVPGHRIVLPMDTVIDINSTASDIVYEFDFPKLGLEFVALPGRIETVQIVGHVAGLHTAICRSDCDAAYWHSPLEIEFMPPDAFADWMTAVLE